SVRLWDLSGARPKELRRYEGHRGYVWGLAFAPGGGRLVSGGINSALFLWDVRGGPPLRRFQGVRTVTAVAFCSDGRHFVSGGTSGEVRLWDAQTGQERCRFDALAGVVRSVACSPDGRWVLAGDTHGDVRLWRLPELK